jgi:hypothetical protein
MLGTASTKQLFASSTAIALIPQVWAEWNYNALVQPYVTTSSSASEIIASTPSASINKTEFWSALTDNNKINGSIAYTASSFGINSIVDTSGKALSFKILRKTATDANWNHKGLIFSTFQSKAINLPQSNGFYKFVFYVRNDAVNFTDGYPSVIKSSNVTQSISDTSSTSSYYYRVVGVGADNQSPGIDFTNNSDRVFAQPDTTKNASVTLSWTADPKALSYRIYRSTSPNSTEYRTSTVSSSYVDNVNSCLSHSYAPYLNSNTSIVPIVSGSDSGGNAVGISYFSKSSDTSVGDLSNRSNYINAVPDVWKKVELWFTVNLNTASALSQVSLNFDITADYENTSVAVDNITLYQVSEHDYYLNEFYSTNSPFQPLRPGEAFTNLLMPSADKVVHGYSTSSYSKPPSFGIKSPQIFIEKGTTNPFIQILPSENDKFKYYISGVSNKEIQAQYDKFMSINKIVLKYNTSFNTINSGSVLLYIGSANAVTAIPLSVTDFNNNGVTVLYYDGSNWSTIPWSSPPKLNSNGAFQNVVSQVRGIGFVAGDITKQTKYSTMSDNNDFLKAHIVELSPRLEIDLSPELISYDSKKELSSPTSDGFPISYINANTGNLTFSNIPLYQSDGTYAATVFENRSKNATFYNLLRQGVKFNCFLKSPDFQQDLTETVPQFVLYSDAWQINDIGQVSVSLYDYMKVFAQSAESPSYACDNSNLFSIITTLFALSGYSDYDYDGLLNVCAGSTETSYFWFDEQKTVFENLQELLIVHQIGAFIDEYGIMRFKSLSQIFKQINSSNFYADFPVTDINQTVGLLNTSYIPNLIPDSYNETISEKIGKIIARYTLSLRSNSVDNSGKTGVSRVSDTTTAAWYETESVSLPSFYLEDSLYSAQNFMKVPVNVINGKNARHSLGNFSGELLVGKEIISYSGIEYIFCNANSSSPIYVSRNVKQQSDIDDGIAEVNRLVPNQLDSQVDYQPTGKILNVSRGLYGTKTEDHLTLKTRNEIGKPAGALFKTYVYNERNGTTSTISDALTGTNTALLLKSSKNNQRVLLSPIVNDADYNLFAVDFQVPVSDIASNYGQNALKGLKGKAKKKEIKVLQNSQHSQDLEVGLFFNLNTNSTTNKSSSGSAAYFVSLQLNNTYSKKKQYTMAVYKQLSTTNQLVQVGKLNGGAAKNISIPAIFDGRNSEYSNSETGYHRLSVYVQGQYLKIAIDNIEVATIQGTFYNMSGSEFGFYMKNSAPLKPKATVKIQEIYADKVSDNLGKKVAAQEFDIAPRYYFLNSQYLNNIIKKIPLNASPYLFQASPQVRGIKNYNIKLSGTPIYSNTSYFLPHIYGVINSSRVNNEISGTLGPVIDSDLQYSDLFCDPFGAKFVVVNNCNELVPLSDSDNNEVIPLTINAKVYQKTSEKVIERVVDPNHLNNSREIQIKWANNQNEVEKILTLMEKSLDSFYATINLSVFYNPLIQVGDFAQISYSLKRVGYDPGDPTVTPIKCLVTAVSHNFSDGYSSTELTLKPIII